MTNSTANPNIYKLISERPKTFFAILILLVASIAFLIWFISYTNTKVSVGDFSIESDRSVSAIQSDTSLSKKINEVQNLIDSAIRTKLLPAHYDLQIQRQQNPRKDFSFQISEVEAKIIFLNIIKYSELYRCEKEYQKGEVVTENIVNLKRDVISIIENKNK